MEGVSGVCMELVHVPDMAQKSRNKFLKRLIFSTDWSQSMRLQSVLKIRCKTSKLFALHASPYKGSKPRVYLDPFVFSTRYRWRFSDSTDHTSDFWVLYSRPWKLAQTTGLLKSFKMSYRTRFILMFWLWYGHLKILPFYSITDYLVTLYNANICNQKECFR